MVDKRGTRYAIQGRRVDYLGNQEFIHHNSVFAYKPKESKAMLWQTKSKIAMLKRTKNSLKLSAVDSFNQKEVLAFCNDILSAHRTNAFGGKPTLWDFFWDIGTNLNWSKQGYRFSKNTKSFVQAMKIYKERRMCDLFTLNFVAHSSSIVKRENKKTILSEHVALFEGVAKIYSTAKEGHQITGSIPVILTKDETKVISRITWESRSDSLIGFCGPKEGHVCSSTFKPIVDTGQMGYENIVNAF